MRLASMFSKTGLMFAIAAVGCGDDVTPGDGGSSDSGSTGMTAMTTMTMTTASTMTTDGMTMGGTGTSSGGMDTTEGMDTTVGEESTSSGGTTVGEDSTSSGGTTEGSSSGDTSTGGSTSTGGESTSTGDASTSTGDASTSTGEASTSTGFATSTGGDPGVPGFVGFSTDDSLIVFDQGGGVTLDGPIDLLPDGNYPYDVTIRPDGQDVWIAGASGDGVVALDASTYQILFQGQFSTGADLYAVDVAFSLDSSVAYVAGRDADAVVLVDAMTFAEIDVSATPGAQAAGKMAVNPCTGIVYVVEWFGDNLMTWDPGTDTWNTVDIGTASLWDVVVHPDGNTVYVIDRGNDVVHFFDVTGGALPAAVPDVSIGVGDDPWGIDITSDGSTLVVACEDDNTVHFIDTATATNTGSLTLPDDADPRDVDIAVGDEFAYVPTGDVAGDDGVYLINIGMQNLDDTYTLAGSNANALAVTPQASVCIP